MIALIITAMGSVLLFSIMAAAFLPHKILSIETAKLSGISSIIVIILSIIVSIIASHSMTSSNEFWHYKITEVRYYEDWNQRVSCRHPKYCTRTVTKTNSKGKTYTTTERYQCGYQHSYDVDYHPEHWRAVREDGQTLKISNEEYNKWANKWNNEQFEDLHRSYHTNDGDMYKSKWTGLFDDIYPNTAIHAYENKVRVSSSVFNFGTPDPTIKEQFPRPADTDNKSPIRAYGIPITDDDQLIIEQTNAYLAPIFEVSNIVYLFDSNKYGMEIAGEINTAWRGPNKNELVTFIGISKETMKIEWCNVISWSDDTTIHSIISQNVLGLHKYSTKELSDIILKSVPKYWQRKQFADFAYLQVDTPMVAYIIIIAITLIAVGSTIIVMGLFRTHGSETRW